MKKLIAYEEEEVENFGFEVGSTNFIAISFGLAVCVKKCNKWQRTINDKTIMSTILINEMILILYRHQARSHEDRVPLVWPCCFYFCASNKYLKWFLKLRLFVSTICCVSKNMNGDYGRQR